jgi:hypothetical protein
MQALGLLDRPSHRTLQPLRGLLMPGHDFALAATTDDYLDADPAMPVLLDAATADPAPGPFAVNTALRGAGVNPSRVRVYELLDGKLHVALNGGSYWQSLDSLASAILSD